MKLELTLMELNEVYYALGRHQVFLEKQYNEFPSEYTKKELKKTEKLCDYVSNVLWDECNKLDEARDYVLSMAETQSEDRRLGNI